MHPRQRYVMLAVAALALLVGTVLGHGLAWALDAAGWANPWLGGLRELPATTVAGYGAAVLLTWAILRPGRARDFAMEVGDELARVNWPTRQQAGHATGVVLVAVALCAVYLGVLDGCWLWATNLVMGVA